MNTIENLEDDPLTIPLHHIQSQVGGTSILEQANKNRTNTTNNASTVGHRLSYKERHGDRGD
jgi:hypothetical protein